MKTIKRIAIILVLLIVIALILLFINGKTNNNVFVKRYTFTHEKLPEEFDETKLFVISDLHNAPFADKIISHIKKEKPDYILMLGDMVQLPDTEFDKTIEIAKAANEMNIPTFAVSGNHDRQCGDYDKIIDTLWANDVNMLENGSVKIDKGEASIVLVGIKDPRHNELTDYKKKVIPENIKYELSKYTDSFSVLLSHRADLYPIVKDTGVSLILSGHLHGGILRLPFFGGVIGRGGKDDLFPDYEYGIFKEEESATMIVSGGCDKNPKKRRYFNPPEVLVITLKGE